MEKELPFGDLEDLKMPMIIFSQGVKVNLNSSPGLMITLLSRRAGQIFSTLLLIKHFQLYYSSLSRLDYG